jgi:hypothetical protein
MHRKLEIKWMFISKSKLVVSMSGRLIFKLPYIIMGLLATVFLNVV